MKKTLSLIAGLVLGLAAVASPSFAGESAISSKKIIAPAEEPLFRAHELQGDISMYGTSGTYNNVSGGSLGGNVGLNYFLTRCLGIGVDNGIGGYQGSGMSEPVGIDILQADLIARLPFDSAHLAPYAMVGGGAAWSNKTQGMGNVGGGLEYRFNQTVGLFADCRWLYGDNSLSSALPRAGVRFVF